MTTIISFPFIMLLLLSCKGVSNHRNIVVTPDHRTSLIDTLLTDTSWYDQYKKDYDKISYQQLNDDHLKKVLKKYFDVDYDKSYPSYCYEYHGKAIKDSMYIFNGDGKAQDYRVTIRVRDFDSLHHHFTYTYTGFLYLIDDKIFGVQTVICQARKQII